MVVRERRELEHGLIDARRAGAPAEHVLLADAVSRGDLGRDDHAPLRRVEGQRAEERREGGGDAEVRGRVRVCLGREVQEGQEEVEERGGRRLSVCEQRVDGEVSWVVELLVLEAAMRGTVRSGDETGKLSTHPRVHDSLQVIGR